MDGTLRYRTKEASRVILDQLVATGYEDKLFRCTFFVDIDGNSQAPQTMYLERIMPSHSYELANKDRVFRTRGRLSRYGDAFDVDVIIRFGGHRTTPATISVSSEIDRVIHDNRY